MNWVVVYYVDDLSNLAKPWNFLRKNRSMGKKNTTVCTFPNVIVPVCSTFRNISIDNTARYATNKLQVNPYPANVENRMNS